MMPPRRITKLTSLHTAELSLVNAGANGKRYALTKSQGGSAMEPEVIAALLATEAEGEKEFLETLKSQKLDEEKTAAAVATFRLQKGMKDLVSPEAFAAVTKAAGYELPKAKDPETKDPEPVVKTVLPAEMSPETKLAFETIAKSNKDLADRSAEMEVIIKEMKAEKVMKTFVTQADADFQHLPKSSTEIAQILKSAEEAGNSKEVLSLLKSMEVIAKNSMELGILGAENIGGGDAWSQMEAIGKEMRVKDPKMSVAKSIVLAGEQNPELYKQYLDDNPAQRSRY